MLQRTRYGYAYFNQRFQRFSAPHVSEPKTTRACISLYFIVVYNEMLLCSMTPAGLGGASTAPRKKQEFTGPQTLGAPGGPLRRRLDTIAASGEFAM
jgi:hypothetical protein